jgi:LemA protein
MMRRRNVFLSVVLVIIGALFVASAQTPASAQQKQQISKDEVFFSIARKLNSINDSTVSAVVAEVDGVIEVAGIAPDTDGKAIVTVKERAPSNAAYTNKSTRLKFAPPASGSQWTWVEFEENRKFYPVDKLFPYAKDELGKRRQLANAKWSTFIMSIGKQGESANKALETAKAVIKSDPPPLATLNTIRPALNQAMKDNDKDGILNAYRDLSQQSEPITSLGDTYSDLKANDAYLRLIEEFKNSINVTNAAKKDYVQAVEAYNEALQRLPFALVAYGLQFTKMESNIGAE